MSTTVKVQIQQRIDTASAFSTANPTLLLGEVAWESDTKKYKIGDGSTQWSSLAYAPGSGGYTAGTGVSISASNVITASAIALSTIQTAANETAMLALTTQEGDVVVRSDQSKTYMKNSGTAGSMADFTELATPTDAVTSVAGNTGVVTDAHIAAAVESATDSNTFTDADHTKLNAIEVSATADQTASEIVALVADQTIAPSTIDMEDDEKILLGTGDDLEIFHNGSGSKIHNNTGRLDIEGDQISFWNHAGNETLADFNADGAVDLYYDGSKKFETVSWGARVTGTFEASTDIQVTDAGKFNAGSSNDLQIYHDGTNNYIDAANNHVTIIKSGTSDLFLQGNPVWITDEGNSHTYFKGTSGGAIELYWDGTKKIETTTNGITVTGTVTDSKGDLRSIPRELKTSAYTLVASDAGKTIATNSGVTVPNNVMTSYSAVTIVNNSGSDITITQASGLTMFNAADAATGNRTLAGRGMATIWFSNTSEAYICGGGLS